MVSSAHKPPIAALTVMMDVYWLKVRTPRPCSVAVTMLRKALTAAMTPLATSFLSWVTAALRITELGIPVWNSMASNMQSPLTKEKFVMATRLYRLRRRGEARWDSVLKGMWAPPRMGSEGPWSPPSLRGGRLAMLGAKGSGCGSSVGAGDGAAGELEWGGLVWATGVG